MFLQSNSAVRGTKRAREIAEEAAGPTTLSHLTEYCVHYNAHRFVSKDPFWYPWDLFNKIPHDLRNIKMNEVLDDWAERLKTFPSKCCPIQTAEINPVTSMMKVLLNTTRNDIVQLINTGPRPLSPTMDIYIYPTLWSESFDPSVVDILGNHYLPSMIMNSNEHVLFINNDKDHVNNLSFIDNLFNRYCQKEKLTQMLGRCRFYASKLQPVGRIHKKIARSSRRTIDMGERFTLRLF